MVIASGYLETNDYDDIESVVTILKEKDFEVDEINGVKIIYLIERQTSGELKREIESLKDIKGVRNVYLTYFSLEGSED